jgi:hypothetical protein
MFGLKDIYRAIANTFPDRPAGAAAPRGPVAGKDAESAGLGLQAEWLSDDRWHPLRRAGAGLAGGGLDRMRAAIQIGIIGWGPAGRVTSSRKPAVNHNGAF